jgi:hypothetical protein
LFTNLLIGIHVHPFTKFKTNFDGNLGSVGGSGDGVQPGDLAVLSVCVGNAGGSTAGAVRRRHPAEAPAAAHLASASGS